MRWITDLFIAVVLAGAAVELWLGARQVRAVAAHRDRVPEPFVGTISLHDHRQAADYTQARTRFGRIGTLLGAALTLALTVGGGIAHLEALWRGTGAAGIWLGAAVIASVVVALAVLHLPLTLWRTFVLEARFGFNRTTAAVFLGDLGRTILLAVLLGGPLLLGALALMARTGRWWWLPLWGLWLAVSLLASWAWPTLIAPLFNRFSPLADPALRSRIEALLERCGFHSSGVFVMDGSRRSAHGNAYFTGIGAHKRIVFFDTLLQRLEAPEIEAVLAHELGHFRLRHIRHRLLVAALFGLAALALFGWFSTYPVFYVALGVPMPSAHAALLLLALVGPAAMFFAAPLEAAWSRRHEFEADRFASQNASARELSAALVKLYRDNASTLTPDPLYVAFYYSHPPALERLARLRPAA